MLSERYPLLVADVGAIERNARAMTDYCAARGIAVAGVIKFSGGDERIIRAYHEGGCAQIASSRVKHLQRAKAAVPGVDTLLLRLPMLCEAHDVVRWCDISLNTERDTLLALNKAALELGVTHSVVLLLDVGDLREGVLDKAELAKLAVMVDNELDGLRLSGVGSTFTCYGSILPTRENLGALVDAADGVEQAIGRRLDIVSGGSSTSLIPLIKGDMPRRINHLRIGGSIANPRGIRLNRGVVIPGMSEDTVRIRAQLVEVNAKPTAPYGVSSVNWAGNKVSFTDRGVRRRAIAALGTADVGELSKLIPLDAGMRILGGSSDHTILDIEDCTTQYRPGDTVEFAMFYTPMLYAFTTGDMNIEYK